MVCHTDPGYHGVDRGEMGAAGQAAVYTGTRQVTSVAHTHGDEMLSGLGRLRGLEGKRHAQPIGIGKEDEMGKETARMHVVDLYIARRASRDRWGCRAVR
jgi:hypothetical protein